MRYTTCIDLTEIAEIWRNSNAVMLYYFMAMKCGFHDDDRDLIKISLRVLAGQTGLTLSATRHALKILIKHKLLTLQGDRWRVTKFILDKKPTSRTQKSAAPSGVEEMLERQRKQDLEKEQAKRKRQELLQTISAQSCREIVARIKEKYRSISFQGVVFYPSDIENLEQWIHYKEQNQHTK